MVEKKENEGGPIISYLYSSAESRKKKRREKLCSISQAREKKHKRKKHFNIFARWEVEKKKTKVVGWRKRVGREGGCFHSLLLIDISEGEEKREGKEVKKGRIIEQFKVGGGKKEE